MGFRDKATPETGSAYQTRANDKGTVAKRKPTAVALKAKKSSLPASSNPDGSPTKTTPKYRG